MLGIRSLSEVEVWENSPYLGENIKKSYNINLSLARSKNGDNIKAKSAFITLELYTNLQFDLLSFIYSNLVLELLDQLQGKTPVCDRNSSRGRLTLHHVSLVDKFLSLILAEG